MPSQAAWSSAKAIATAVFPTVMPRASLLAEPADDVEDGHGSEPVTLNNCNRPLVLASHAQPHVSPVAVAPVAATAGVAARPRLEHADGSCCDPSIATSEIRMVLELKQSCSVTAGTLLASSVKMMSAHCTEVQVSSSSVS